MSLLQYYNAKLVHCPLGKAHEFIDEYQMQQRNTNYLWIPGGGHIPEAAFGYVDAAMEIMKQAEKLQIQFDAIFLPCGTGTTQAGLVYGLREYKHIDIWGVSVARPVERCIVEIEKTLLQMNSLNKTADGKKWDIRVLDNMGIDYGDRDPRVDEVTKSLANSDGIFLDPIYNGKSFWRMQKYLEEQRDYKNVLYLNTGGTPNIFI